MFRFSNRFRLRKLLENGRQCKTRRHMQSNRTSAHKLASRCFSNQPLSWFEGSYAKRFSPLFNPLPSLKLPPCLPDSMDRCATQVTTLPNGLKIASEDSPGPAACLGIYVDSGSIYETEESTGVTDLLDRLAFKSTKHRSHFCIVRDIEAIGAHVSTAASREQMAYSFDTLKAYLPEAVELLIDCIRNPIFLDSEVREQLTKVTREVGETRNDPQFLLDSLHVAGYSGALGNPLMAPEAVLGRIDGSTIRKFYRENYTADRMVLAAFGVDHEHLLSIAEPLLYDLQRGPPLEVPKSTYSGGDFRHKVDAQEKTDVALAFEVPGGWHQEKDAVALTVLQTLMGGGSSFSAGGPGKGMHSRLYLRVLNQYQEVQSFSAVSSLYNDTGVFGIHLTTGSDFVAKAVDIAANELLAIATPGQVTELELHRAKNATRSVVMMNLQSRAIVAEDIGRQILTFGCRKPVEHFLQSLDELTLNDLTVLAQNILSSPLTMASCGDVDRVPSYASVSQLFQATS